MENFEIVIIGAGPAGLSAALVAGRSCRKVLVLDGGPSRNERAHAMHSVLSRDGMNPLEYLEIGRQQLDIYDVAIRIARATSLTYETDRTLIALDNGETISTRSVIMATGVTDHPIDLPGVAQLWGTAIGHCPYCHGWEVRDQAIAVLATMAMSGHQALLLTQWSNRITYFLHQQTIEAEERAKLEALGVVIVEGLVQGLDHSEDTLRGVIMEDGRHFAQDAMFLGPNPTLNNDLLVNAKAEFDDDGVIVRDMFGKTSLENTWIVGDAHKPMGAGTVTDAVAEGARAAAMANAMLVMADAALAVADATVAVADVAAGAVTAPN